MRVFALSLVVLSACASSSALPARPPTQTVEIAGSGGGRITFHSNTDANVSTVAFPLDRVWAVLPAAFDSLAIPVGTVDPAKHIIGNEGFKVRQRLGKIALSRYMDCGTTQIGPNADSYDVHLTVLTQVQPGASGATSVATTVEASARPITFAQAYSQCSSRGLLESRLVEAVRAQLKR